MPKKKPKKGSMQEAFDKSGQTVKKATAPFTGVMGAMERLGNSKAVKWLFGIKGDEERKKRLKQSGK